jgi:hypothetical protein
LESADLSGANLQSAYLFSTNLESAYLWNVSLEDAFLGNANLQNAYLARANLEGASLSGANLQGANLNDIIIDETTILSDGTNWTPDTDMTRFTDPNHPDFWRPTPDAVGDYPWWYNPNTNTETE